MSRKPRDKDPYDMPPDPSWEQIFRVVERKVKLQIRTHVPASVISYNAATQTAMVQVQHLQVVKVLDIAKAPKTAVALKGEPPNADATLAPIQLPDIPVSWPRTNAGYITFPLMPGDTGELHVSDRSMKAWRLSGIPAEPASFFTHALKDSVFYPGLHADVNPIVPPTDLTASVLDGALIKIGRTAVLAAARATDPLTASPGLIAWAASIEAALSGLGVPIIPLFSAGPGLPSGLGTIASGSATVTVK